MFPEEDSGGWFEGVGELLKLLDASGEGNEGDICVDGTEVGEIWELEEEAEVVFVGVCEFSVCAIFFEGVGCCCVFPLRGELEFHISVIGRRKIPARIAAIVALRVLRIKVLCFFKIPINLFLILAMCNSRHGLNFNH